MDLKRRNTTTLGLILSVLTVAVVAYRNDLSSNSNRHGCVLSTIDPNVKESVPNPLSILAPSSGGFSLYCNLRTLNREFWNYTFSRDEIEKTKVVKIRCSDRIFFESVLSPNQSFVSTLTNLQQVQLEACKIRKLSARVWSSLTKLKTLTIRTQNTEWKSSTSVGLEVEPGAFEGLGQLQSLEISENNIWNFGDALCPLRNLANLNVSWNKLGDIEELISASKKPSEKCELISLKNLDLSHNSIKELGPKAFSRMKGLSELRLQYNDINKLDDMVFDQLPELKLLNLSSSAKLVTLPPFIFKSNVNLKELYLQNNTITALSPQVFRTTTELLLLDLSNNRLTSEWIKEDMFQGLIRLIVLRLSGNSLTFIDSVLFRDLISLQALYLNGNRLETINPEAFSSLKNLHTLDISRNRLSYIDGKTLSSCSVLRQLFLDHNRLRTIDNNALKNCTQLQDLGLGQNLLQEVPSFLPSSLTALDIGENKISLMSNTSFSALGQLIGLRLVDNPITSLPSGFCLGMKKLRVLNLSQSKITSISPNAFTDCPELRVLRLDSGPLEHLPPNLAQQLPSLLWFNISENRLWSVDFRQIPESVEWLDISYNLLESIITHGGRGKLRVLNLDHNKLRFLNQSHVPSSLETLRLNFNEIRTIVPKTFMSSHVLKRVELIGNKIETLALESIQIPPVQSGKTLPEFYLGQNNFKCSCEMEWLSRVNQLSLSRQHPRVVDLDAISCRRTSSRSTISGNNETYEIVPLLEARPKDFLCPYTSHCFALCHCCGFACDCEMTCPDGCSCFHDNSWSTNIVDCSSSNLSEIPATLPMDVSEARLDGNTIYQLPKHIFIGRKNLRVLYLNNSHVEVINNRTFNGLKNLEVVHLENNLIAELNGYEFDDVLNVREIYIQDNLIQYISPDTFAKLNYLQALRLDGNRLRSFHVLMLSKNSYLNSVMLSGNPFDCDCDFLTPFRSLVASKSGVVVDFHLARCQSNEDDGSIIGHPISSMCTSVPNSDLTFNYEGLGSSEMEINNHISSMGGAERVGAGPPQSLPPSENHNHMNTDNTLWTLILCLTGLILMVLVILAVFRQEIYYWTRNIVLGESESLLCFCCPRKYSGAHRPRKISCPSSSSDDLEKLFDAYFLYSRKDEDLLLQKIVPELEDPTTATNIPGHKFRLCLHYRDLSLSPDSPWNREMILSACDASKRVVILLSRSFLQSEWSTNLNFRTSIQSAIGLHQKKVIFLLLPDFDLSNVSLISSELSSSMIKNSCVQWADKNFWTKFKRLFPSPSILPQGLHGGGESQRIMTLNLQGSSDPSQQLPYNLIMNPNLHHLQQLHQQATYNNSIHQHYNQSNILPYQIPIGTNTLPPVPKHQIVLPGVGVGPGMHQGPNAVNGFQRHHNTIISSTNNLSLIHPRITSPQHYYGGYNKEKLFQSNYYNHHPSPSNHQEPIHFSSQNPHHHQVIPPHQHTHSQISNSNFSSICYPSQHQHQIDQTYNSSSAVSSCPEEFDHVYSTLDSPLQSPSCTRAREEVDYCPNGGERHQPILNINHSRSASSGVSSGSENSATVSPSSPLKNGILNKINNNNNNNNSNNNGKMYFV